ncbi:MAG: RNA polymerase sigma factor [Bacteroidota bacterium]
MNNPLAQTNADEQNKNWVKQALQGDREALNQLIQFHQPFIYQVAWKMVHDPDDALDLTQEVLIKVITKLSQFNFQSAFRTWLYRIVVNEFLLSKRRSKHLSYTSFEEYGEQLDAIPNPDLSREEELEIEELSKEMQIRCMSGMLMCLNREQRLIYILGDTFQVDHQTGAEIFDISPQNFRVKLHRARKDLYSYMQNKCGLINKENPCRCPKKAKALKDMGMLDPQKMQFNIQTKTRIMDYVEGAYQQARTSIEDKYQALYQEHPARDDFDSETVVKELVNDQEIRRLFNLN